MSRRAVRVFAAGSDVVGQLDGRGAFPVSGDVTARHRAESVTPVRAVGVDVWRGRNVRPALATAGIVVGCVIRAYGRDITVTHVGTIAEWGMLDGREVRWDAHAVRRVVSVPDVERAAVSA